MNQIFAPEVFGIDFDPEKALLAVQEVERHPEPPVVFPDCPKCLKYADAYGFCWACNERTVGL